MRFSIPIPKTPKPLFHTASQHIFFIFTIEGRLRAPFDLPFFDNDFSGSGPSVLEIDPKQFPYPDLITDWYLQISPEHPQALTTHWQLPKITPAKHLGYALQWFSMSLVLLIAFIFANSNLGLLLRKQK